MSSANIIDLDYNTLEITHQADGVSTASFVLARRHDNIDYTLAGVYSPISNQNDIVITYKGIQLFTGKVVEINADSQTDTVKCICNGYQQFAATPKTISIPLSGLNSPRYMHDAILSDVNIKQEELMEEMQEDVEESLLPANYASLVKSKNATKYYNGVKIWYGMHRQEYTTIKEGTINWINGQPYDVDDLGVVGTEVYDPSANWDTVYYHHIVVEISPEDSQPYRKTYVWVGGGLPEGTLISAQYIAQTTWTLQRRKYDNTTGTWQWIEGIDLGYYTLGGSPYQEISASKNGVFISDVKYITEGETELKYIKAEDWTRALLGIKHESLIPSLYKVKEGNYNYIGYVNKIAAYEYRKLLKAKENDIGSGSGLEIKSSATISVTLDTLLYYNIKLLSKINLTNTIQEGIYCNANGFPLSVKQITISGENMTATLNIDNEKTQAEQTYEELELELAAPDEPEDAVGFKTLIYKA